MKKKAKKKFSTVDFAIAITVALFLSVYFLPHGVNYFMTIKYKIPFNTKQEILLAGKTYLNNNVHRESVTLTELFETGYLIDYSDFYNKNCFLLTSTVNRISLTNNSYSLNLECLDDKSTLTLLE